MGLYVYGTHNVIDGAASVAPFLFTIAILLNKIEPKPLSLAKN